MKNSILIIFLINISFLSFGQINHLSDKNRSRETHLTTYSEYQNLFSSLKKNPHQSLTPFQKLDSLNLETYLGDDIYSTSQSRQWQYNDLGQITSYLFYREIVDYGMYLDFKIDYTYNISHEKITKNKYRKNTEDELYEYSINNYLWDLNHQLVEDTYSVKNFNGEEFTNQSQSIYSWSSTNQIEGIEINDWDPEQNSWSPDEQHNFYYSNEGVLDSVLIQYWISETNTWKDFYLYKYEYNENQEMIKEKAYIQYIGIEYWEKRYKIEYDFDEIGNNIERITFAANLSENTWRFTRKKNWSYDESGNIIEAFKYEWDPYNETWISLGKKQNSYDYNYSKDQLIIPLDYDLFTDIYEYHEIHDAQNMWLNSRFFSLNTETQVWEEQTGRTSLYYSNIDISNTDKLNLSQVTIHPNPTSNLLFIDSDEKIYSEIFNLTGEKVYSTYDQTIDISHLEKGVYFIRIKSDKKMIKTQKIIKL